MIHVAICDDEKVVLDQLRVLVSDFFLGKNMEVCIDSYLSGEELLNSSRRIDLLFLDIQMGKMDGMGAARVLRGRNYRGILIFITVLKEMVFESFEVGAFAYLLKPISRAEFQKTMERLVQSLKGGEGESLLIRRGSESRILSFEEIVYCEVIDRKVYLHLRSGEICDYYNKMDRLEAELDGRFFRCHRSYLVNLQYLNSYKNSVAYLMGNHAIPVSRLRSSEFSNVILQYMKEWR